MLDKFRETSITWDKASRKVYEPLRASAGDNKGRKLSVQVVNGGVIESLSGASLSLFWETKDKSHKGLDAFTAVDATKGEFEIYYTTGMLSNEGTLNANLVLVDTSGRVVSEPFTITVFKGIDDDAIQSDDSFTALTEALAQVGNINNKADRTELLALESTFEQNKVSVEQQLQKIDNNINITPDDFEGSDIEKITKAYIYASENDIPSITLNRTYDLTGGTVFIPSDDWAKKVQFFGGKLVKKDSGFMFSRISENQSINAPTFLNVVFEGVPGTETVIYNGDVMIRTQAFNCEFSYIAFIRTVHYTQSLIIANSLMQFATSSFIDSPWNLDIVLANNRFETSDNHLLEAVSDSINSYAITAGRIENNVIEGYSIKAPIKISSAISLKIDSNYFEKNAHDVEFVNSSGLKGIIGSIVRNSFFGALKDLNVYIDDTMLISRLRIENNSSDLPLAAHKAMMNRVPGYFENNFMSGGNILLPSLSAKIQDINLKADKSLEPFIVGTTLNGWTGKVEYAKNDLGQVVFKAKLIAGTVTSSTSIALLPIGYRPLTRFVFGGFNTSKGVALVGMYLNSDGNLYLGSASANVAIGDAVEFSFIMPAS